MKGLSVLLGVLLMVVGLFAPAHAALVDMSDGTIYDTDTQLSWLKDANTAGAMTWEDANTWVASLNAGSGFAGFTNWRLPATAQPDTSCSNQFDPGSGFPIQWFGFNCTSEMAYLYYTELGNAAGGPLSNTGPFTNLQAGRYWSGTEYVASPDGAWAFGFGDGSQNINHKDGFNYALAVRPGSRILNPATAVPALGTMGSIIFMVFAGLGSVYYLRRRRMAGS